MAKEFNLDPIIVGASGSADRTAELAAAKARVILGLNFPSAEGGGRGETAGMETLSVALRPLRRLL